MPKVVYRSRVEVVETPPVIDDFDRSRPLVESEKCGAKWVASGHNRWLVVKKANPRRLPPGSRFREPQTT